MGETPELRPVSDAAGRRAHRGLAARSALKRFCADARGATAIEYALVVSMIFLVIITSVTAFGNKTTDKMKYISDAIAGAIG